VRADTPRAGFSLIELAITLAIVAVVVALAIPSMSRWAENERLSASVRTVDGALGFARSEAIRTGNVHLVFVGTDTGGNPLVGPNGDTVDVLVVDDGQPGTAGQNCQADAGEASLGVGLERDVLFGVTAAGGPVPTDPGLAAITSGTTFADPGNNPATWLLFRPDGPPLRFTAACVTGAVGSGGGGVYLTNGGRDKAIVLTPLGSTRTHSWNPSGSNWTT
jgi:prepilin-type N-terminal cleavage/methylation domain-containing protein